MKFAAIDIGSNAIRVLFYNVFEDAREPVFKKISLTRLPVRLGEDVFSTGRISDKKIQKLIRSMAAFRALMDVYEVDGYRAYATSAMREAENGLEVIQRVFSETGVIINIIDGNTEADVIFANKITESTDPRKSYLYIDVGGGSTELTLFSKNKKLNSASFTSGVSLSLSLASTLARASISRRAMDSRPSLQTIWSGVCCKSTAGNELPNRVSQIEIDCVSRDITLPCFVVALQSAFCSSSKRVVVSRPL